MVYDPGVMSSGNSPGADRRIYLDNAATTAVRPEVIEAMAEVMARDFANPSSRHGMGLEAERRARAARALLADLLGAPPEQLVFTSGGTEANNLAVLGIARAAAAGEPGEVIIDYPTKAAMFQLNLLLERRNGEVARVGPEGLPGVIDLPRVAEELYRTARVLRVFTFLRRRLSREMFLEAVTGQGDSEPGSNREP